MVSPYLLVVIAGACAGAWPLVMQRSGFSGPVVALVYSLCSLAAAAGLWLIFRGSNISGVENQGNWGIAIGAGALAAVALVLLSTVVAKVPAKELSLLYIVMLLVQIAVPVLIFVVINRGINLKQGLGLAAALVAALLLR